MDLKSKNTFKLRYLKEVLASTTGLFITCSILFNLSQPQVKNEDIVFSSTSDSSRFYKELHQRETLDAAFKVEKEQEKQSLELLRFKKAYLSLINTKMCLAEKKCDYDTSEQDLSYENTVFKDMTEQLQQLQPQLVSNWFRLSKKAKHQILSFIYYKSSSVKEEVLDLLNQLDVLDAEEHLSLVLRDDPKLYEKGLLSKTLFFLNKMKTDKNELKILNHIAEITTQKTEPRKISSLPNL